MKNSLRAGGLLCAVAVVFAAARCGGDGPTGPGGDAVLVRVSGDGQQAAGLSRLASPLVVRAVSRGPAAPLARVPVRFAIVTGAASGAALSDTLSFTDSDGVASTELSLGDGVDTVIVTARAPSGASQRFTIIATPAAAVHAVSPPAFGSGDTVTLRGTGLRLAVPPGVVRFGDTHAVAISASDTLVRVVVPPCVATGLVSVSVTSGTARSRAAVAHHTARGTEVSLEPFHGVTLRASELGDCLVLSGAGARYLVVPHFGLSALSPEFADVEIGAGLPSSSFAASGAASAAASASAGRRGVPHAFERVLRRRESMLAASPPAPAAAAVRAAATAPAPGALRSFRVISTIDATAFATVRARLAFAGANVLVWVDTLSPSEFPYDSLDAIARVLDVDLHPLAVGAFGETSDVDGDGRVHIVLSPVVNALTPAGFCSLSGFVGAFFSAHDLYPGSPNANGGEILYGFVPDTAARYGCAHSVEEFARVLPVAFVHELQHVISYYQHVLRRGGLEEEIWLNEGLSHAAEELASKYYEARYPWPAGRESPEQLFPDSSSGFIFFNLVNAYLFLRQPYASSLTSFQEGGTIEERGGAWLFVRWLADQYGEDMLRRLVQTPMRGAANVADRTAEPFAQTIGDFAIALYADSLPGVPRSSVPSRWRFHSRNWRALFQRLHDIANFPPFPIETFDVEPGGSVTGSLRAGGFVFLTVDVPADAPGATLRFRRQDGAPWRAGDAPRVSVFRLP